MHRVILKQFIIHMDSLDRNNASDSATLDTDGLVKKSYAMQAMLATTCCAHQCRFHLCSPVFTSARRPV